ncbi:hypothetical protein SLS55_002997 [Diplodia seriata]|uniref:Integral membrane protein n=1 Tax=Diplodia seriata TaxID=420778 RepID=A0ABR3CLQ3_9PEZI
MGHRKIQVLAIAISFICGCYAISAEKFADESCYPTFSYDYLWGDTEDNATDDTAAREGSMKSTRQDLKKSKITKVTGSANDTEWLTKMNVRAPLFAVNDTKATAFRVEEQGWKIVGADLNWWWMYYVEDDWSLQKESEMLKGYPDVDQDPLEVIRYDLDLYSGVAFPCNSTLSTTLLDDSGDNPNASAYGSDFIQKFRERMNDLYLSEDMLSDLVTQYLKEELQEASRAANQTADSTYWKITASYMGVGWNVKCWGDINTALNMATEWDKAASSAATTLMALIPVLLTFGNLILPRDSEAFCSSFLVGIMSAAFSLGLPGMSEKAFGNELSDKFKVYPLSEKTKTSLDTFIQTPKYEPNGETGIPRSTETELPPRYHPLIGRGLRVYYRTVSLSATSAKKQYHRVSRQSSLEPDGPGSLYHHNKDTETFFEFVKSQCNIFVVSYTIALLLVFVTGGRLLSLLYIWQSAKTLGLHVIECQTNAQISGSLRILCSMTGVLVVVNGAYYYEGHRLDERQGWNAWREKYDRGDYDKDDDNTLARSHSAPATQGSFAQNLRRSGLKEAWKVRRKPVGARQDLPRHRSEGSQSEILLQDISYHSRMSSANSLDSNMPRAPEATAGHPYV